MLLYAKIFIKKYHIKVPLNGITCLTKFYEIYPSVQKLLAGDTHTGDLIRIKPN